MKILRIALRNLASLAGTHTVDFTREPLRSAGLFSISGPTGSGKSTLLDALCLALYEKTPRLAAASGEHLPDGATAAALTPRDPGNLLRRGAVEGFAEVAFVGVDGLAYTARWSLRRARLRPEGALQNSEMVLLAGNVAHPASDPVAVGGRKTEVLPVIAEKVGLTFAQFTRAVLLAQNDFAVFLKASDQDRASILEALTGTERFAAISRLVFERHKAERAAVDLLADRLAGAAPLEVGARAAAEAEQAAASAALLAVETALAALQQQLRWFEQDRELASTQARAAAEVVAARAALEAAAPREADLCLTEKLFHTVRGPHEAERLAARELGLARDRTVEAERRLTAATGAVSGRREARVAAAALTAQAARALGEAQPGLQRARLLDAQLEALLPRLAQAATLRAAAESARRETEEALRLARERHAAHEARLASLAGRRAALASHADFVDDFAAWRDRLAAAESARVAFIARGREAEIAARRLAGLRSALEKTRAAAEERQRILDQAAAAQVAADRIARSFDLEALAARRRALDEEHGALAGLRGHLERIAELGARIQAEDTTLAALAAARAGHLRAHDEITRTSLPAATAALGASQSALRLLEAAADQVVPRLRAALLPEKPCPVCGSLHHPDAHAAHRPEPAALRFLREQVAAHQKDHDELRAEQTRHQTALELGERERSARQATADQLAVEMAAARARLPAVAELGPVLSLPESERLAALEAVMHALEVRRGAHERDEHAQRSAAAALAETTRRLDAARTAHAEAAGELVAQRTEYAAAEAALAAADTSRSAAEREHAARFDVLAPLLRVAPEARAKFEQDAAAFAEAFMLAVESLRRLRRETEEVTTLRAEEQARLPGREEAHATALRSFTAAGAAEEALREEQAGLRRERESVLAGRPAALVQQELESAAAKAQAADEARAHELAEAEKALVAAAEFARAAQSALEAATVAFVAAGSVLDRALAGFLLPDGEPLGREALAPYLARDGAWLEGERAALAALRGALQVASGREQAAAAALAAHRARPPGADAEEDVRAAQSARVLELAAAKERLVAASAVLAADEQRRREADALFRLIEARRAVAESWGRLDELIGSADGAKFRALVQRHALDILLRQANAQLELIAPRYRLERLPDSLNLMVCDREMADERRSVFSLSGGESFLVSLSLALGLAGLTSNRLRVESLFIDEGFGSLDPATLETAMGALMRLESQGRKVGVISHVTEMADAIPVQIRVVKGRGGASRLEVPGAELAEEAAAIGVAGAPSADGASLAERAVALLEAAQAAGEASVSLISLRKRLGCDLEVFEAVRARLGARVVVTGRSLRLAPGGA